MKSTKPNLPRLMLKIVAFLFVPLFIYLFLINGSFHAIGPEVGEYSPSDEELNFIPSIRTYKGEGLYRSFSIVYPPGRFIAQSAFFHILEPTVISSRIYMNLFTPLLYTTLLFLLSYTLFSALLKNFLYRELTSYLLALLAVVTDIAIVHSAQEVHIFMASYILILLTKFNNKLIKNFLLGLFLGLIFLFRIEAGIMVVLATIIVNYLHNKTFYEINKHQIIGFSFVWVPALLAIITKGSLPNFLYDTIVLGYYQPKVFGQPIPHNELRFVFAATLIALIAFSRSLWQKANSLEKSIGNSIKIFTLVSLFSYVTALGRSDEGHLWYGLVWISIYASYIAYLFIFHKLRRINIKKTILLVIIFYLFAALILKLKTSFSFLVLTAAFFIVTNKSKIKSHEYALAGIISSLLVFHSISYLSLRLQVPVWAGSIATPWKISSEEGSIAGLNFSDETMDILKEINSHIPANSSFFIFPDHNILYEYFSLPRATRYFNLLSERTDKTERDLINDLKNTDNLYILVFSDSASKRGGEAWDWIQNNTIIIQEQILFRKQTELRRK